MSRSLDQRFRLGERRREPADYEACRLRYASAVDAVDGTVEIAPTDIVKRRAVAWDGMAGEIVQATRREKIDYRFRELRHLLVVYEQGARRDGDTLVEGLPRSALRDFKRKLTFVPAGHEYREWHDPRTLTRLAYFYLDPAGCRSILMAIRWTVCLRHACSSKIRRCGTRRSSSRR